MNTVLFKTATSDLTRRIEQQVSALGGTGPDLYERVCSLQHHLDEYEFRQLRFIGVVSREMAEIPGYKLKGEPQRFIDTCRWAIERLDIQVKALEEQQRRARLLQVDDKTGTVVTANPAWGHPRTRLLLAVAAGVICLGLLPFFCVHTVERSEWPSGRSYTEDVVNWPVIVFWTVALMLAVFQSLKFATRRV